MKIRNWMLGAVATALVLTGCTVTVGGGGGGVFPPEDADPLPITAGVSESATPSGQVFFLADETLWFEVDLTQTAQGQEAFFFELSAESSVKLTLFSSGGTALASTTKATSFFGGTTGLASASSSVAELEPAGLTAADICVGACVIRLADSGTYYARVTNTGSARNITVYAYARNFYDSEETGNDSAANAVPLSPGVNSGAIERIGDVDFWDVPSSGTLQFSAYSGAPEIERRIRVRFVEGGSQTYSPGGPAITVLAGDTVEVYEAGDDAAGPAGFSGYTLNYSSP